MTTIPIEGIHLRLRDWRLDDLEPYAQWFRPGQSWKDLDAPYYPLPTEDELEDMLAQKQTMIEEQDFPSIRTQVIISDKKTDTMIGSLLRYWQSQETHWLCLGIVLYDPASWGRGLGFEALGLWGDYLFQSLPELPRLDLRTWSGNLGMMRLAEKLGYKKEACFRKARFVRGHYYDGLGYGVLREEWQELYPQGFHTFLQRATNL
jgi:putative hydrolase of HD superfamily